MKRKIYFTVAMLVCLLMVGTVTNIYAQGGNLTKKEIRKQKRALRKAEQAYLNEQAHNSALEALNNQDFTLSADMLYTKYGRAINVSNNLNFVQVSGDKVIVQLSVEDRSGMPREITLQGTISDKKFKTDKHGNRYFSFNAMGTVLNAEVNISLNADGNYADATISGMTTSRKVRFSGNLVATDSASVFQSNIAV